MSWKHEEWRRFECPCGKGGIVITMHESDNGYSGDDYSGEIECGACKDAFTIKMVGRGSSFEVRRNSDGVVFFRHTQPPIDVSALMRR